MDNDMNLIKSGLYNYMGSIIEESIYDERGAKQQAVSITMEQVMRLCKDGDRIDFFALKPVLRVCINLLKTYRDNIPFPEEKQECERAIRLIESIVNRIK